MALYKPFPNEAPIKRLVRGHIYNTNDRRLVEFIKVTSTGLLAFRKVAVNSTEFFWDSSSSNILLNNLLALSPIKEVAVMDLPLYINWKVRPRFKELMEGIPPKTRKKSKSSIVISKRKEYEKKRLERKFKYGIPNRSQTSKRNRP